MDTLIALQNLDQNEEDEEPSLVIEESESNENHQTPKTSPQKLATIESLRASLQESLNQDTFQEALADSLSESLQEHLPENQDPLDSKSLSNGNAAKNLKCPKCNWHYKYKETLDAHLREKHAADTDFITNKAKSQCNFCQINVAHPKLSRGESYPCGYKPYRCAICNYSTTSKGNLTIHMQSDKHMNNVRTQAMLGVLTKNAENGGNHENVECGLNEPENDNVQDNMPGNKVLQALIQKLGNNEESENQTNQLPNHQLPTSHNQLSQKIQQIQHIQNIQNIRNSQNTQNSINGLTGLNGLNSQNGQNTQNNTQNHQSAQNPPQIPSGQSSSPIQSSHQSNSNSSPNPNLQNMLLQQLLKQSHDTKLINAIQAMNALNQQQQQAAVAVAAASSKSEAQFGGQPLNSPELSGSFIRAVEDDSGSKRGTIWHCDLCNYKTEYASNLRIHSKSDKHRLAVAHKTGNMDGLASLGNPHLTTNLGQNLGQNIGQNLGQNLGQNMSSNNLSTSMASNIASNMTQNMKSSLPNNLPSFNFKHHNLHNQKLPNLSFYPHSIQNHHSHSQNIEINLIKCPLCPTTFSPSPKNLLIQEHLIVHHKVQPECVKSVVELVQENKNQDDQENTKNLLQQQMLLEHNERKILKEKFLEQKLLEQKSLEQNISVPKSIQEHKPVSTTSPPSSSNNQSENSQSPTDLVRDIVEATKIEVSQNGLDSLKIHHIVQKSNTRTTVVQSPENKVNKIKIKLEPEIQAELPATLELTANSLLNELKQRLNNSQNQLPQEIKTESKIPDLLSDWMHNNSKSAVDEELPTSHESSTENLRNPSNSSDSDISSAQVVRNALSLLTGMPQMDILQNGNDSQNSIRVKPGPKPGGTRKPRTVFNEVQVRALTENFEASPYPSEHDVEKISLQTGLDRRVIIIWFQNRRSKYKKKIPNMGNGGSLSLSGSPEKREYEENMVNDFSNNNLQNGHSQNGPTVDSVSRNLAANYEEPQNKRTKTDTNNTNSLTATMMSWINEQALT